MFWPKKSDPGLVLKSFGGEDSSFPFFLPWYPHSLLKDSKQRMEGCRKTLGEIET